MSYAPNDETPHVFVPGDPIEVHGYHGNIMMPHPTAPDWYYVTTWRSGTFHADEMKPREVPPGAVDEDQSR